MFLFIKHLRKKERKLTLPGLSIFSGARKHVIKLIEAATGGALQTKKVFLKISQNSQENTCARNSFLIKLHT